MNRMTPSSEICLAGAINSSHVFGVLSCPVPRSHWECFECCSPAPLCLLLSVTLLSGDHRFPRAEHLQPLAQVHQILGCVCVCWAHGFVVFILVSPGPSIPFSSNLKHPSALRTKFSCSGLQPSLSSLVKLSQLAFR